MDLKRLRPTDDSSVGIEDAIERMQAAVAELKAQIAQLEAARPALLLTAETLVIDKHDAKVRALGIDRERIMASIEALLPNLAIARGRERIAEIDTMRLEASAAAETFNAWWREKYPILAREIAGGIELETAALRALAQFHDAAAKASRNADVIAAEGAGAVLSHDATRTAPAFFSGTERRSAGKLVCLPATEPGPPIHWPYGFQRVAVKTGEAAAYA